VTTAGHRLATLEIGRGIAALFVALYHMHGLCLKYFGSIPFGFAFVSGHAGVEFFFVLSGFIIYYVHHLDIGKAGALASFCTKRAIRLLPMYWIVITLMLVAFLLIPRFGAEKQLNGVKIALDYLLIPRDGALILPPAWTLQRELLFYCIFGLTILAPRLGFSLFLAWQGLVLVMNVLFLASGGATPALWFLFGVHNFGFLVGLSVAWLILNRAALNARLQTLLMVIALLGIPTMMFVEWNDTVGFANAFSSTSDRPALADDIPRSAIYSLLFGLAIYACATWERRRDRKIPQYLALFGASSYVIYLIHEPLGSLVMKVLTMDRIARHMTSNAAYLTIMVIVILASMTIHLVVETRITRYLRERLLHTPAKGGPVRRRSAPPNDPDAFTDVLGTRRSRQSGPAEIVSARQDAKPAEPDARPGPNAAPSPDQWAV
jgi:exopolysaccharide production protein ExoZ